jgi:hypothetical protein
VKPPPLSDEREQQEKDVVGGEDVGEEVDVGVVVFEEEEEKVERR